MKRFFAIVLAVLLVQSSSVCFAAAKSDNAGDIMLLKNLGIEDISSDDADKYMTREDLAYLAYGICCGGKIYSETAGNESRFFDVPAGTHLAEATNALYDMKIMFGTGDDRFEPEGSVGVNAVITVMLRTAGYGEYAKTESESIKLATNLGLLKNISIENGSQIKIREAAAIAVNALDVKVNAEDNIADDKLTVLENNFGLYYEDGVFYSSKAAGLKETEIMLDGKKYDADRNDEYEAYDGLYVRVYINRKDDKVAFVDAGKFDNRVFIVEADDIISVKNATLKYTGKNGKESSLSLKNVIEIYNGKAVSLDYNDFVFKNGRIVFTDNGNGKTALIERYDTMVVGAVSDGIVRDYYNPKITVDLSDEEDVKILLNGESVSADEIKKGNVLSIARTKDDTKIKVYLSQNTLSGLVTSSSNDYFSFDRRKIYRTDYFIKNEKNDHLGKTITLAIDYFGRAAAVIENDMTDVRYGYLANIGANDSFGKPKVRIFDSNGDLNVYPLADNVTVNGINGGNTADSESVFMRTLRTRITFKNGVAEQTLMNDYVAQPVGYTLNQKGQIRTIDTAVRESGEDDESLEISGAVYNIGFRNGSANQFSFSFRIDPKKTVAFYVPDTALNTFDAAGNVDTDKRNSVSDDDFRLASGVVGTGSRKYDVTAYNLTDGGAAGIMIVDNKSVGNSSNMKSADSESAVMLVESIAKVKNRKEELSYCVTGWINGKQNKWIVAYPAEFIKDSNDPDSVIGPGDVIQISTDVYNEIDGFTLRYDYKNKKVYDGWEACNCMAGYCYSYDEGGIIMRLEPESAADEKIFSTVYLKNSTYVYNDEFGTVRLGTVDDLKAYKDYFNDASTIFVRTNYSNPSTLVIYE